MAGKLRKLFTDEDIMKALLTSATCAEAAEKLSELRDVVVSRQNVEYWAKKFDEENLKKNGDPYVGTTVLDRKLRSELEIRKPSRKDWDAPRNNNEDNSRILHIPDQHAPYQHPDTLDFLATVVSKLRPTRVINLGDETDGHAMSFHDSDPSLASAGEELTRARQFLHSLAKMFPEMDICHSNHGSLVYRKAFKHGIPAEYIRPYRDFIFPDGGGDGWRWEDEFRVTLPNGQYVVYRHHFVGNKNAVGHGLDANVVQGHEHGKFYIVYDQTSWKGNWSLVSGCLIDPVSEAFAYGKLYEGKPVIGCSGIIDSQPILIPMDLDKYGRWTGKLSGVLA